MHRRRLLHWVSQTTHPQLGWRNYPPVEKLRHSTRQRRMGLQRNCSHATWQRYTIEPKEWSRWHATTTRHVCFSNNIYYSPHYRRIVSKQGRARNRRNPGVIFTHTIVFFLATRPRTVDVIEISSEAGSARKSSCTKPVILCRSKSSPFTLNEKSTISNEIVRKYACIWLDIQRHTWGKDLVNSK